MEHPEEGEEHREVEVRQAAGVVHREVWVLVVRLVLVVPGVLPEQGVLWEPQEQEWEQGLGPASAFQVVQ